MNRYVKSLLPGCWMVAVAGCAELASPLAVDSAGVKGEVPDGLVLERVLENQADLRGKQQFTVLSAEDLSRIKSGVTRTELLQQFGEPMPSTIPVLTWPKAVPHQDYPKGDFLTVWRNGYWFFFDTSEGFNGKSRLQYIASFAEPLAETKQAMVELFPQMRVNWPANEAGKTLAETLYKRLQD